MTNAARNPGLPLLLLTLCLLTAGTSLAATVTASLNISLAVSSSATLTFGATSLSFSALDPTIQPLIPANENPISVLAKIRSRGLPTLAVLASDDLRSGADVIPITAMTWAADASPYVGGTLSKSASQPAAAFPPGSGSYQSALRFFLANSPLYLPGSYASTVTYTLIAP